MRRRVAVVALTFYATSMLPAQNVPVMQTTRDLTIDGKTARLDRSARIKVRANGTIAIAEVQGTQIVLVDRDMRRIQMLGTPGDKPGAINVVQWFGWIGDSLWVADLSLRRITLFAPDRSVARTISFPLSVEGPPGTAMVNHGGMPPMVEAIYPDGSLLIHEFGLRIPSAGIGGYLLRSSLDGQLRSAMGSITPDTGAYCFTRLVDPPISSRREFCSVPDAAIAPNGRFKARVRWPPTDSDSTHFTVTNVGERGDTLWTRTFPFTPVPVTSHDVDSAVTKHLVHMLGGPVPDSAAVKRVEAALRATAGPVHPPVTTLLAGNDGTVWLEVPSSEPGRHWLMLDLNGVPSATATVPGNVTLLQAQRGTAWGREVLADSTVNIVRYRIGPAGVP